MTWHKRQKNVEIKSHLILVECKDCYDYHIVQKFHDKWALIEWCDRGGTQKLSKYIDFDWWTEIPKRKKAS